MDTDNIERNVAKDYMLHTGRSIFLTGRAGSGKTTLLKEVIDSTDKNIVVVAPTGVAAINAGGVTIHSLFHLPLTAFVPDDQYPASDHVTSRTLLRKHMKYSRERLSLIREMDTLVIDEVSMVRADMLDAIDFVLRSVRRRAAPFGGVQVIMIGDLYQLPPVVKEHTWTVLQHYYTSAFFFSSHVWQKANVLSIELQKVYRQKDDLFLSALNKIRNGDPQQSDIKLLNQRYIPDAEIEVGVITLCTHNATADAINQKKLKALKTKSFTLNAKVTGKFNENAYPVDEVIKLRIGAMVMFTRNDSEGLYYNGKIAKVIAFNREDEEVKVEFVDDKSTAWILKAEWKNEKYTIDEDNQIKSEVLGEFVQFPLRLAWAVTVHKSQGLTLDRVQMDLSKSFAAGQAYVALSRCTSLEGLVLQHPITKQNVIVDSRIVDFHHRLPDIQLAQSQLEEAKKAYSLEAIRKVFAMHKVVDLVEEISDYLPESSLPGKAAVVILLDDTKKQLLNLLAVGSDFDAYLSKWIVAMSRDDSFVDLIYDKTSKGIAYFTEQLYHKVIVPLHHHIIEYQYKSKVKKYMKMQQALYDQLWKKMDRLYALTVNGETLGQVAEPYTRDMLSKNTTPIINTTKKGSTKDVTLHLYEEGSTIEEIINKRGLKESTILSHLAHWVKEGKVKAYDLVSETKLDEILYGLDNIEFEGYSELIAKLDTNTTYGEINIAKAHKEWLDAQTQEE